MQFVAYSWEVSIYVSKQISRIASLFLLPTKAQNRCTKTEAKAEAELEVDVEAKAKRVSPHKTNTKDSRQSSTNLRTRNENST